MIQGWKKVAQAFESAEKQICTTWREDAQARWAGLNALELLRQHMCTEAAGTAGRYRREFLREAQWQAE